jgi:hypothetical protein
MKKFRDEHVKYLKEILSEWTPNQILEEMRKILDEEDRKENEIENEIKWYEYPYGEEKE